MTPVRSHVLLLACALVLGTVGSTTSLRAQEPEPCAEALREPGGDEVARLERAETARWRTAKRAASRARKLRRQTLGLGESQRSLRAASELEALHQEFTAAVAEARVLCGCRERRGDPNREDCDRLYARWQSGR